MAVPANNAAHSEIASNSEPTLLYCICVNNDEAYWIKSSFFKYCYVLYSVIVALRHPTDVLLHFSLPRWLVEEQSK